MNEIEKATIGIQQAPNTDAGVQWLVAQQNTLDGSWGVGPYSVAQTALAVLKLETYALEKGFKSPLDPNYQYNQQVQNGLNYIFSRAQTISINNQIHGNPDSNSNGIGVFFRDISNNPSQDNYDAGIALMALVASGSPLSIVSVPGAVNGRTYKDVAQDIIDFIAWGQTDLGSAEGGWYYMPVNNAAQDNSDNSVSGWVVTGLAFAAESKYGFSLIIPNFVKTELKNFWIKNIQDPVSGGSQYRVVNDPVGVDTLKTGNLLLQMSFVGYTSQDTNVQKAIEYLNQHWNDANSNPGWKGTNPPSRYQAAFTMTKGLLSMGVATLLNVGNWYTDMANVLGAQQNVNGSWPQSQYDPEANGILSTEWALLAIERVAPQPTRGLVFSM